ncbi:MAG: antibiotic biosynthesis monooxygenase [Actinomycetota bacterium]|nr:antibiotic biosynthesis monooxygenase [Actinomycetota bacterium]
MLKTPLAPICVPFEGLKPRSYIILAIDRSDTDSFNRFRSSQKFAPRFVGCDHTHTVGETTSWEVRPKGAPEMFAAIRYYQADPPSIDEVVRRVQEDHVPLIRELKGFVSYFILLPSEREEDIVSVSVFEDQQSAEESNRKAAEWVVQNLRELLRPTPEFAGGRVVVYEASQ